MGKKDFNWSHGGGVASTRNTVEKQRAMHPANNHCK